MKIEIQLYSLLRRFAPKNSNGFIELEISERTSVATLVNTLGIPENSVMLITLNGKYVKPNATLNNGDKIGLYPPIGAG